MCERRYALTVPTVYISHYRLGKQNIRDKTQLTFLCQTRANINKRVLARQCKTGRRVSLTAVPWKVNGQEGMDRGTLFGEL
jgi:hypothetical protein